MMHIGLMHMHIMPNFTGYYLPLDEFNDWLQFFDVPGAPDFTCASRLIANASLLEDGMAPAHSHCWSPSREFMGHYRYDLSPEDAVYTAYYTPCTSLSYVHYPSPTRKIRRS